MKSIFSFGLLVSIALGFTNCKKSDIMTYDSMNYLQYTDNSKDTVYVSFFSRPKENTVHIPAAVKIVGQLPQTDRNYTVEIDTKETTALPAYFKMPSSFVFGKGKVTDTAYIDFIRHNDLLNKSFVLVIKITKLDAGGLGQTNFTKKIFKIDNIAAKPAWWNFTMESNYLGVYTEKKFRVFMDVTGVGMLDKYTPNEQREFMLAFKRYLIEKRDLGDPVLEEDGTDMLSTVPLLG